MSTNIRKVKRTPKQQYGFNPNLNYSTQFQPAFNNQQVYAQPQKVQPQPQPQPKEEKKEKKRSKAWLLLLLLLLLSITFIAWRFIGTGTLPEVVPGITFDKNQDIGDLTGKSKDEIVSALNEKVAEGMINVSMDTHPIFENGKAKGTLKITNSASNRYPQLVEIYTKDDNQLIYSGGVDIGHSVDKSTLSVNLPKGEYDCIAYFHAIDPDTNAKVGTVGANIKITILN